MMKLNTAQRDIQKNTSICRVSWAARLEMKNTYAYDVMKELSMKKSFAKSAKS